jgi:GntR family transcriptional regulator
MYIKIDHQSSLPIYKQIVDRVKYYVAAAKLSPGDKLPSVRALSQDLQVNPTTVVKAYDTLEAEGVIYGRQGQGVFVSDGASKLMKQEKVRSIAERCRDVWVEAIHLGLGPDETRAIFEAEIAKIERARRDAP